MSRRIRPRNALYAQSGGPTPVINATACAVIEAARQARGTIGKVYAARYGIIHPVRAHQFGHARRRRLHPRIDRDHTHSELRAQPRRLGADSAHAQDHGRALGQVEGRCAGRPLAPRLLRPVARQPAGEGEHDS